MTTLLGFAFGIFGILIIFWNEGRAVQLTVALQDALNQTISIRHDAKFDKTTEGQVVHISGPLMTGEPLTAMDYNIMVQAVKLKRRVQMYQWVEETVEHNYGTSVDSVHADERSYYYTKQFRDEIIDHRLFYISNGHENPSMFPMKSEVFVAEHVNIGQYELGAEAKDRINTFMEVTSDTRPDDASIKMHSGMYYHSDDLFNPEIGDIRIQFSFAGLQGDHYTLIGQVQNGQIVPYVSRRVGKKLLIIKKGSFSVDEAFKQEHRSQRLTTWGIRFIGFVFIFFCITCTSYLLAIVMSSAQIIQCVGGQNPAYPVSVNLMFALSISLLVTSIAWILHRPWLGASLLCTALSPILLRRPTIRYQRVD